MKIGDGSIDRTIAYRNAGRERCDARGIYMGIAPNLPMQELCVSGRVTPS
jgi:hypothetical protein